jgi:hypothetical protein
MGSEFSIALHVGQGSFCAVAFKVSDLLNTAMSVPVVNSHQVTAHSNNKYWLGP